MQRVQQRGPTHLATMTTIELNNTTQAWAHVSPRVGPRQGGKLIQRTPTAYTEV